MPIQICLTSIILPPYIFFRFEMRSLLAHWEVYTVYKTMSVDFVNVAVLSRLVEPILFDEVPCIH